MFKTLQTLIVGMVLILVLVGCEQSSQTTISEIEYKQALGKAVCEAVADLNSRGVLDDAAAIENEFDGLIQNSVKKMGYSADDWLAAKSKYFSDEAEHTKLVKMHFTWCLVGDSISE
ncbi:MAG: hypothetical protein ABIE14_00195 [Patescibacteria group bacterium]